MVRFWRWWASVCGQFTFDSPACIGARLAMERREKSRFTKGNLGITVATYGLLALASVVSFSLPQSLQSTSGAPMPGNPPPPSNQIRLAGVVRDFPKSNAAFQTAASGGNGHYAGNVGVFLGTTDQPVYTGSGHKITTQWRDSASNNIAPNMYHVKMILPYACTGVHMAGTVLMKTGAYIDSFDSSDGAYGSAGNLLLPTQVSTNLTSAAAVTVQSGCTVNGDLECGP